MKFLLRKRINESRVIIKIYSLLHNTRNNWNYYPASVTIFAINSLLSQSSLPSEISHRSRLYIYLFFHGSALLTSLFVHSNCQFLSFNLFRVFVTETQNSNRGNKRGPRSFIYDRSRGKLFQVLHRCPCLRSCRSGVRAVLSFFSEFKV